MKIIVESEEDYKKWLVEQATFEKSMKPAEITETVAAETLIKEEAPVNETETASEKNETKNI